MKYSYLFIAVFLPLLSYGQTVPNGNFEEWTATIWSINPDEWETQNAQLFTPVTQDLDAYQGEYAMKVTAVNNGLGSFGDALTTFPIDAIPASLDFYVKSTCVLGSTFVMIRFYNGETEMYNAIWYSSETIDEWTPVSLELAQIDIVTTHASIQVVAEVGDLAPGMAELSVDSMRFNTTLNNKDRERSSIKIFPNPSSDKVQIISEDDPIQDIQIFNSLGTLVKSISGSYSVYELNVEAFTSGVYIVQTRSDKDQSQTHKIIVQ